MVRPSASSVREGGTHGAVIGASVIIETHDPTIFNPSPQPLAPKIEHSLLVPTGISTNHTRPFGSCQRPRRKRMLPIASEQNLGRPRPRNGYKKQHSPQGNARAALRGVSQEASPHWLDQPSCRLPTARLFQKEGSGTERRDSGRLHLVALLTLHATELSFKFRFSLLEVFGHAFINPTATTATNQADRQQGSRKPSRKTPEHWRENSVEKKKKGGMSVSGHP